MIHLYHIEYRGYVIRVAGDELGFGTSAVFKNGILVAENEDDLATVVSAGSAAKFWVDQDVVTCPIAE